MKPTSKVVDLNAPRMKKGEFSTRVITKDLWKRFISDYPEYRSLTLAEFKALWEDIAQTVREQTVFNPLGVKLGARIGELKYQYLPYKFKADNIAGSIKLGRPVTHLNIVNKGKVGKVKWERRWAVKYNKMLQFYAFEPDRKTRIIAKKYTDENPDLIRMARNTLGGFSIWRQL